MSLRQADRSSRGVLPTVVRFCVRSRNPKNEEAMTCAGSQRYKKKSSYMLGYSSYLLNHHSSNTIVRTFVICGIISYFHF